MPYLIREKTTERFVCMIQPYHISCTQTIDGALVIADKEYAEAMALLWSKEPRSPDYVVVEKPIPEETEHLYMIRENQSMTYVAVIGADSVGNTKDGKRAIHYRDESVAEQQARILNVDAFPRTYSVIVSQTSVGIK